MAISTLAGARLVENTPDAPFLPSLLPFLKGFTVLLLGHGDLVDPDAGCAWRMASRRPAVPASTQTPRAPNQRKARSRKSVADQRRSFADLEAGGAFGCSAFHLQRSV